MLNANIIKPYDSPTMTYDSVKHRYILTTVALNSVGNTWKDDQAFIERRLKQISNVVYNWIYSHTHTSNIALVEFVLACTEKGRQVIEEALTYQLEADVENGYNDISKILPINPANGQVIKQTDIKENAICIETRNVLEDCIDPIKLIFSGSYGITLPNNRYSYWSY